MKRPPKQIAATHCKNCGHVAFASHVNSPEETPPRFCQLCGHELDVYVYSNPNPMEIAKSG